MGTAVQIEKQTDPADSASFYFPWQVIEWLHFINANDFLVWAVSVQFDIYIYLFVTSRLCTVWINPQANLMLSHYCDNWVTIQFDIHAVPGVANLYNSIYKLHK